MTRKSRILLAACFLPAAAFAQYQYYFTDNFGTINPANWTQNGTGLTISNGLADVDPNNNGGSLIATAPGANDYEVRTVLNLTGGGSYVIYLRATSNSLLANGNPGTYYAVDLTNPTCTNGSCLAYLFVFKSVAGSLSVLSASQVTCRSGSAMRAVIHGTAIAVWMDGELYQLVGDTSIASGQPGVGVINTATTSSLTQAQFGAIDTTPPYPVTQQSIGTSSFPNRVNLQWAGVTDTPNGIGLAYYDIYRNGTWLAHTIVPEYSDTTVSAPTSYTYLIAPVDYHLNATPTTFTVQTAPPGSVDPRRVGVRPTGSYWGASSMGENLDLLSGNLNFSLPLLKPVSRGGWGVTLKLSYNSQNWRQDPGGTWLLGRDVGYGFGWRLMAGSLTPYYSGYWSLDHYVFTDSTGAEYRLTQVNNGVWTSQEGIYLSYDSNAQRLYFPDGSFWVMGCMAAGDEQDAGTMYPTQMEDTNGNQINITYNAGLGAPWANSSARINTIQDIRDNGGQLMYTFSYTNLNPPVPHLTGITNNIGTAESYTLNYVTDPLQSPFSPQGYGVTSVLNYVQINGLNLTYNFFYDAATSGELSQVTLPTGGSLGWGYTNFTYLGSRTQPEVQTRTTYDGVNTHAYAMGWDPSDSSRTVHHWADWYGGPGDKEWIFNTSGPYLGLIASYYGKTDPSYAVMNQIDYTWTTDAAGNPYISTAVTTNDPGTPNAVQKQVTQTQDAYGNLLQMQIYDWGAGAPGPVLRTYTNTYLNTSNYTSRYIYNRLSHSQVGDGTHLAVLVSNTYDTYNYCAGTLGLGGPSNPPFHDSAYSSTFLYRGNVTQSTTPAGTSCRAFDIMGNAVATQDPIGRTYTTNINAGTNYAAPSAITTNGTLTENLTWSSFLGLASETGPNFDSATTIYDGYARPYSTTSPYGATTVYSYTPNTTTATVNLPGGTTRWTKTTVDGFGRPLLVETGYNSTTVSQVDSVYGPCGCSPIGKLMKKSQPHAPGGTQYWTTYTYDGIGRTTSVQLPDGASTTTYVYWANVVGVWDPAGNWKHFVQDANGNLTLVREPNQAVPNGSQDFYTSYSYDILNHLTGVSMTRPSGTQTRSFNYNVGNAVGAFLLSKTEPETGTTTYTYSGGLLQTKVDTNGSKTQYTYDSYGRVKMIQHYPYSSPFFGTSEDTCQRVTFSYDSDPTGYSQNALGRQTSVQYQGAGCGLITPTTQNPVNPNTFVEMYSYSPAGLIVGNKLLVSQTAYYPPTSPTVTADLEATYTYNNEGTLMGMTYPSSVASGITGDTYTYSFDSMNRPMGLTDQTTALTAVNNTTYGPANEMTGISYGAINETRTYNSLLQLKTISAYNVGLGQTVFGRLYTYSGTNNTGKIQSETDTISAEVVTYQYDALNRLASATGTGWGQSFVYDGFGNLMDKNITGAAAPPYHTSFNIHNQDNNVQYDANGNQTVTPTALLGYDVENRMVTANPTGVEDVYSYGRGNRRVYAGHWQWGGSQYSLSGETVYFYSVTGQKLGTYQLHLNTAPPGPPSLTFTLQETRVWFGGRLVMLNGQTVTPDRLGSFGKYYPFGEDRGAGNPPGDREKFATYTRDSDTNLDYAVNRYYNSVSGRFLSADPYRNSAGPSDPGSWNRYAYTRGDPINRTDPSGMDDLNCGAFDFSDCGDGILTPTEIYSSPSDGYTVQVPGCDIVAEAYGLSYIPLGVPGAGCSIGPAMWVALLEGTGGGGAPQQSQTQSGCFDWSCMPAAFSRAIAALTLNQDCMNLFGTDQTRAGKFNPVNVLTDIVYGSHNFGTVSFSLHSANWGVAQTRPAGFLPITGFAGKVKTTINELLGYSFWNNGDTTENADTLLHELGHAFNDLKGAGGFALTNAAEDVDQYAFDKLIKQTCFH